MKKHITNFLLLSFVGVLVYGSLQASHNDHMSIAVSKLLQPARNFYAEHPLHAIALFCLAHLVASALSLPGSCTVLNTISGAVFGFWRGCAIVYPITIFSAILMYGLGTKLHGNRWVAKYRPAVDAWRSKLGEHEFLFLIGLRLSPLVPFGMLNLLFGMIRVPFSLYLMTTVVGIFFDVTLLNNLGAGLRATSAQNEKSLAISFFVLLIVFFLLRIALTKAYDQNSRGRAQ